MLDFVKEAFLMERKFQEENHIHCETIIDGYTDFIFVNRFGKAQHQGTLNKAIRRIIRDCNDKVLLEDENPEVLLHILVVILYVIHLQQECVRLGLILK